MKKRILTLLEVEGLFVLIRLLDARIWLLKRIIRLTEASISLLDKVIDYKSEDENEPARAGNTDEPKG